MADIEPHGRPSGLTRWRGAVASKLLVMGRKFFSDVVEKRAAKRSEKERALAEAHADHLVNDPEFIAQVQEIDRQIAEGTYDPGPGLDIASLRRRYMT